MEYFLGQDVIVVKKNSFYDEIENGNYKIARIVAIRHVSEDGRIEDTSYLNSTKVPSGVFLRARDKKGFIFETGADDVKGYEYEFITHDYLVQVIRDKRAEALERFSRLDRLLEEATKGIV